MISSLPTVCISQEQTGSKARHTAHLFPSHIFFPSFLSSLFFYLIFSSFLPLSLLALPLFPHIINFPWYLSFACFPSNLSSLVHLVNCLFAPSCLSFPSLLFTTLLFVLPSFYSYLYFFPPTISFLFPTLLMSSIFSFLSFPSSYFPFILGFPCILSFHPPSISLPPIFCFLHLFSLPLPSLPIPS